MLAGFGRRWTATLPLWPALAVFVSLFLAPLIYFFIVSFWTVKARIMRPAFSFKNYVETITSYGDVLVGTLVIAFGIALVTTFLAFLFAYAIRFKLGRFANLFLVTTLITLFGGYLVKIYAWKSILGTDGVLNKAMLSLGLIAEPVNALVYSVNGVVITLTYFLLPFAVLPIYGSLRSVEDSALEAARDLGAMPWPVMRDIILPQCQTGLMTAFTLSFLISVGDYVTPRFVGGGAALMGTFIENQFSFGFNWPLGSAMAFTTMFATLILILVVRVILRRTLQP
ncbi:MAG: ABC transporter permease [Hyphomicrobiales bacterium]